MAYGIGIAVALTVAYVILVVMGAIPNGASFTDDLMTIPNQSAMEFKIIYTSRADLFVTDYAISLRAASRRLRRAPTPQEVHSC